MKLILASSSPRRREILSYLNIPFVVHSADIDETPRADESPQDMVLRLSREKAQAIASANPHNAAVVLAADTTVALDGTTIGKPRDADDAKHILKSLRGRAHDVYTGLTLAPMHAGECWSSICQTHVHMREYSDDEIRAYIASTSPFDKAGAYAIQDKAFFPVTRIEGCYLNVMGLPLCEVLRGLCARGADVNAREPVLHDCLAAFGQPCFVAEEP